MSEKTAIVLSGGGMRCAYNSGALLALQRHFKFTSPDMVIAASGSVPAMLYYISEQYRNIEKLWTNILGDNHKALSPTHLPILNIDYLIDTISKEQLPLDFKTFNDSGIKYYIPLRNAENGNLKYIDNTNDFDLYEVMRAATAVPLAYGKEIQLGEKKYIDGFYGLHIETLITKAIDEGATTVIAIDCSPVWSELETFIETFLFEHKFGLENKNFYEKSMEHENINLIYIAPKNGMPIGMWETNKKEMIDSFFLGYQNISNNKKITDLIKKNG